MGITPGGATPASFMSYGVAKRMSKNGDKFGTGQIEGVIAPETAAHAAGTSALLPMLTLGIPGSPTAAVLLGGLLIWGLQPGPLLFVEQKDFVWGLIASMYLGNLAGLLVVLTTVPLFAAILRIPFSIIAPVIIVICAVGAYTVHNSMFDVYLMLVFGVLGYMFKKLDYPLAPLVLALVLGDRAEDSFRQAILGSQGDLGIFFSNGLVGTITALALLLLFWPVIGRRARARPIGQGRGVTTPEALREEAAMTVIAMTQEMATLGTDVAQGVAQALGLKVVQHEVGDTVAERMQVKRSLIRRVREGQAGWLEKRGVDSDAFAVYAADEILTLAQDGNVVIRGWGATSILRGVRHIPCIRVCAPMRKRVQWLMERLDTDDAEMAREEIERSEASHVARTQQNFGVLLGDPMLYDLTLNTGRVSVASCIEQVIALSRRPEFQPTPESAANAAGPGAAGTHPCRASRQ